MPKKTLNEMLAEILPTLLVTGSRVIMEAIGGRAHQASTEQALVNEIGRDLESPMMNPETVQIRKIENGFLVQFEEAVGLGGATPEQVRKAVEEDIARYERLADEPVEIRAPESFGSKMEAPIYRWKRQELYCRDYRAICREMPKVLQALVLRKSARRPDDENLIAFA